MTGADAFTAGLDLHVPTHLPDRHTGRWRDRSSGHPGGTNWEIGWHFCSVCYSLWWPFVTGGWGFADNGSCWSSTGHAADGFDYVMYH